MTNLNEIISTVISESGQESKKINKHLESMQNAKEFKHIEKFCTRKKKKCEDIIYGDEGVAEGKYTYTGLLIKQIDLYKHLISYLKRKNTEGGAQMNGVMYVQKVIKRLIRDIKVSNLDKVGGTNRTSLKYTDIDLAKMKWFCYNNLLDIMNDLYRATDEKNLNIEEAYKDANLL